MKILICGATGFIGRNIAEILADATDHEIFGTHLKSNPLIHPKITMLSVDLTNKQEVDKAIKGMDLIIQAAATTSGSKDIVNQPYLHVTDNAVMNSLIFKSAHDHHVKQVIFFSCTVMYQSSDFPVKESDFDANVPIYPKYFGVAWTKFYIEKLCEFYANLGRTKYSVIRHTNIYGPYDKFDLEKSHVFGATVTKVMTAPNNGKIMVWGSGDEERDLLYVTDLVDFVKLALEKQINPFELVNVGYSHSISVNELVNTIIQASGKNLRIEHDINKPTIKTKLCVDTTKAKEIFGWNVKTTLKDGISKTLEWYKRNIQ